MEYAAEQQNNAEKGKSIAPINRWHNNLDPEVTKHPLTNEEERIIFLGHKKYGNKWADIARLLKGRTDNVVKNFFYSTMRRQLRRVLKSIKKSTGKKPKKATEFTMQHIQQIMKEYNVSYKVIDNKNLRDLLLKIEEKKEDNSSTSIIKECPSHNYSL